MRGIIRATDYTGGYWGKALASVFLCSSSQHLPALDDSEGYIGARCHLTCSKGLRDSLCPGTPDDPPLPPWPNQDSIVSDINIGCLGNFTGKHILGHFFLYCIPEYLVKRTTLQQLPTKSPRRITTSFYHHFSCI